MNIGLVVEGPSDLIFFESQKTFFQSRHHFVVKIVPTHGKKNMIKDAHKHLKILRSLQCDKVIYFIDQDFDACPPATAARLNSIKQEADVLICVLTRELEGWFLADSDAVKKATGQNYNSHTDDVTDAKEVLRALFKKDPLEVVTDIEVAKSMLPHYFFPRASNRNRSITRFLCKI